MAVLATADLKLGTNVEAALGNVINRKYPFLASIPVVRGNNATGPLFNYKEGGITVAAHGPGDSFDTPANDATQQPNLGWGMYEAVGSITDEADALAAINQNPAGETADQKGALQFSLMMATLKKLEGKCFSGTGSNEVIGVKTAIAATGTYAGLDHASVTSWTSVVWGGAGSGNFGASSSGTATVLSKAVLRSFISAVKDNSSSEVPEFRAVGGSGVVDVIKGLFDSNIVYSHNGVSPGASFVGQTGPTTVEIEGIPFIIATQADGYFSDETALSSSLFIYNVDPVQPRKGVHIQVVPYRAKANVIVDGLPYGMQIIDDPTGAHSQRYVCRTGQLQLVVPKPLACGRLKDIKIA